MCNETLLTTTSQEDALVFGFACARLHTMARGRRPSPAEVVALARSKAAWDAMTALAESESAEHETAELNCWLQAFGELDVDARRAHADALARLLQGTEGPQFATAIACRDPHVLEAARPAAPRPVELPRLPRAWWSRWAHH